MAARAEQVRDGSSHRTALTRGSYPQSSPLDQTQENHSEVGRKFSGRVM